MIIIKTAPIGVNSLYRGRKFLTKKGKAIKEAMAWEVKSQWKEKPLKGNVSVNVIFYFKDRRMLDIDGGLKALFDCLNGIVWKDDKQITELIAYKEVDKKNPRIELSVIENE